MREPGGVKALDQRIRRWLRSMTAHGAFITRDCASVAWLKTHLEVRHGVAVTIIANLRWSVSPSSRFKRVDPDPCFVDASLKLAAHPARCTARHGVGSHAEPPTMEWAIPATKNVTRQWRSLSAFELEVATLPLGALRHQPDARPGVKPSLESS
jgi:hypothetical protein